MFFHDKRLQYHARPDRPDPIFANKLQEILGGQFGEMTVSMQYLFQGWNCRGPEKYRDMLLDIGTEELAHVEMLCTMIGQLLESAPTSVQENAAQNPLVEAAMGGSNIKDAIVETATAGAALKHAVVAASMNPQHFIVSGLGAMPTNSVGVPWTGGYMVASGNLMADFRHNLTAESQGRLQAVRLYEQSEDPGVRDFLSFLIARDTMHQNQWMAAIEDLQREGLGDTPVPMTFPQDLEQRMVSYQFWNCSEGDESAQGRWASGPAPDGKGEFEFVGNPEPMGTKPDPNPAPPNVHGTNKMPVPPSVGKASLM